VKTPRAAISEARSSGMVNSIVLDFTSSKSLPPTTAIYAIDGVHKEINLRHQTRAHPVATYHLKDGVDDLRLIEGVDCISTITDKGLKTIRIL
jgi:hypothetical protein